MNNELYHYGVLGMKWGIRRYQDRDGNLTEAGQRRYNRDVQANLRKKKDKRLPDEALHDPDRWVREDLEKSKKAVDTASKMTNTLKTVNNSIKRKDPNPSANIDLSNMTDKELRDKINRTLLERQYRDVCLPKHVDAGKERINEIIDTAGTVLTVSSSAIGIALVIKELKS